MSLRDYSKEVREELGSIGVLQQKPGSWNIKLLMLIKGNQITQINECSGFFVWEDARVWDHWNCHFDMHFSSLEGFPGGASGIEPDCQWRGLKTLVQSLSSEDPLEWEMASCSSILARKFPWTEESGGLQSMGLQSFEQLRSTFGYLGPVSSSSPFWGCSGVTPEDGCMGGGLGKGAICLSPSRVASGITVYVGCSGGLCLQIS